MANLMICVGLARGARLSRGMNSKTPWGVAQPGWMEPEKWSRVWRYQTAHKLGEARGGDVGVVLDALALAPNSSCVWEFNVQVAKRPSFDRDGFPQLMRYAVAFGEMMVRQWTLRDRVKRQALLVAAFALNVLTGWWYYRRDMASLARIRERSW